MHRNGVTRRLKARQRGAALLIMLVVLVVGALYFVVSRSASSQLKIERERITADALAQAKEALIGYAITYRDTHPLLNPGHASFGYFPCPDMDGDGGSDAILSSTSTPNCGPWPNANEAAVGLLPYHTLGLPVLRDGSGECLWYAVSGSYKAAVQTATPTNWDTQGQFRVKDASGNILVQPDDSNGGAAVIIFAVGAPLAGQARTYISTSRCGRDGTNPAAFIEGNSLTFPSATSPFVIQAGDPNNATNNDRVSWITPKELWDRIVQRSDFSPPNSQVDQLLSYLQAQLAGMPSLPSPKQTPRTSTTPSSGPQISSPTTTSGGDMDFGFLDPNDLPTPPPPGDPLRNWLDQFHYMRCDDDQSTCLMCNGAAKAGALIFSGRGRTGNPHTSVQQANLNEINRTANPSALASALDTYLEGANFQSFAWPALNSQSYSGATSYSNLSPTTRALDVVLCLDPRPSGGGGH
jgi:hypothetical protein